jgi:hypothetical protein
MKSRVDYNIITGQILTPLTQRYQSLSKLSNKFNHSDIDNPLLAGPRLGIPKDKN